MSPSAVAVHSVHILQRPVSEKTDFRAREFVPHQASQSDTLLAAILDQDSVFTSTTCRKSSLLDWIRSSVATVPE